MPYIKPELRKLFDEDIDKIVRTVRQQERKGVTGEGLLNYVISRLLHCYLRRLKYADLNRIVGVLECAKLEFYQQIVRPYEALKRMVNGSVSKWDK